MSLYYTLVFAILVLEIAAFSLLSLPIRSKYRRKLTLTIIKPFEHERVQTAIRCVLVFILVLFLDAINKVYAIESELQLSSNTNSATGGSLMAGQDRMEVLSRKFFAQRNMYLTGITLFLTYTVTRTFSLVTELLDLKDNVREGGTTTESVDSLQNQIAERETQINTLKEKALALEKQMEADS